MKILYVLELYFPNVGGNEKLFQSIGESLVKQGHEVTVVTSRFNKDLPPQEIHHGVNIIRLPLRNRYLFTFFGIFRLLSYAGKADLIHTTSYNAAIPAWLAGKLKGKPVVITFHEVWGKLWFRLPFLRYPGRLLFYIYEQFILRLDFKCFIAVSEYTRHCLARNHVRTSRVRRIYNGLAESEYDTPAGKPTIVGAPFTYAYFGRLGPSKGIDVLMEASARFLQGGDRRLLLIASRKPSRIQRYISGMVSRNDWSEKVEWLDHMPADKLREVLQTADCIVIPSASEGFCYAAAEAAAMRIPVVASGRGSLPEVVSGKHLFLEDLAVDSLLSALEKAEKGLWDQKPLQQFLLADCARQYLDLYSSVAAGSFA